MSGIGSGIDYSILYSSNSSSDVASSLLTTLYSASNGSAAGGSTAVSTGNPLTDLQLAQANQTKDVAAEANDPTVSRALASFKTAVAGAKDIATALQNPAVLNVLLTANGMADQIGNTALASKALLSDPSDPNSLVNQLSDTRWKTLASTYSLSSKGLAGLSDPTVQSQVANAYQSVTWMNSLDAATPGLAEALQFKANASKITNVDQILGDPINWQVVLTALGIPQQIAFQDQPAQEQAVSSRLDISKLQSPTFVNSLTDQYLLSMQQSSQGSSSSPTSLESLAVQSAGIVV